MSRNFLALSVVSSILLYSHLPSFALDLQVGDIKDSRTTGQFFSGLELDLKLVGDEMGDAKAIRTTISSAQDSTGRDLIDESKIERDFQELGSFGTSDNKVTLKFKNPSRKAESLKEIKGSVELYIPKNDPQSTITLKSFKNQSGKMVDAPALKASGVELAFYTAAQYGEQQKKDSEKKAAEMRAQGMSEQMIEMANSFSGGFGGGSDQNAITMKMQDKNNKIVGIEFRTASGEKIDSNGSMTSGDTVVKYFNQPVPDDAQILIFVASPKALVSVPLQLSNVALP